MYSVFMFRQFVLSEFLMSLLHLPENMGGGGIASQPTLGAKSLWSTSYFLSHMFFAKFI